MLDALLRKGYLPKELPPLFSTEAFADCIKSHEQQLPAPFTQQKPIWTLPTHHNLARVGGLRRRLSVPNPFNFFRLARTFDANATVLNGKWAASPYSHTKPAMSANQTRAIAPSNQDRATPRALIRVGARYLLRADISQFYPSIYTHTIPWAAHTKEIAKANRNDMRLFGNVLDKELQACQHGQTKGIAVGPDTSLGIAELLLSQIDCRLTRESDIRGGVRFIDDMELTFRRLADGENALCQLEGLLFEYELQLNSNKTKIVELPDNFESAHVTHLRPHIPDKEKAVHSEWVDFFNKAFLSAREYPDDGVLRYAVACLQAVKVKGSLWELVQSLLWQCIAGDPGCLRFVIDVLWINIHRDQTLVLDKSLSKEALDALIARSAPIGHGSEVLWSIWAALLFDLKLSAESAESVSLMEDSFVAVAASLADERSVFSEPLTSAVWARWLEPQCFNDTHWLFAYEAYRRGWMADMVARAGLNEDACCEFLKRSGVSFVRDAAIADYQPERVKTLTISGSESS